MGDSSIKMPWGKFRGIAVSELPFNYVEWLLENVDIQDGLLLLALEKRNIQGLEEHGHRNYDDYDDEQDIINDLYDDFMRQQ